jgi:antagonist of KipI
MSSNISYANAVLRVVDSGLGGSIQDRGRSGWRRYGVPSSGWMDAHAAECANRLLENQLPAPVIEMLLRGAKFEVLQDLWVAICGADVRCTIPTWRASHLEKGAIISFSENRGGVWIYLAVEGGFAVPQIFGSASYYARGQIGTPLTKNLVLYRNNTSRLQIGKEIAGRLASWSDRRDYSNPPKIKIWPGPQWSKFSHADRHIFLQSPWTVTSQCDRVGYRLEGTEIKANPPEIISEPVRVGSIQIPENGRPIITMRDGPTVGGYPKIALIDTSDFPWVAQARPGQKLSFQMIT